MAVLDIIILGIPGISVMTGLWKGLISQLKGIIAIVLGAWAAMKFNQPFSEWLSTYMSSVPPVSLKIISYIAIFVIVMIFLSVIGSILNRCIKLVMLGWANRLLGAFLAVLICLLCLGITAVLFDSLYANWASTNEVAELPAFISESKFYEPVHKFGTWVFPYLGQLSI